MGREEIKVAAAALKALTAAEDFGIAFGFISAPVEGEKGMKSKTPMTPSLACLTCHEKPANTRGCCGTWAELEAAGKALPAKALGEGWRKFQISPRKAGKGTAD